ncbi:signal peptidase II [candidate division LCP-89 bacterium B3_LCP]|uniref:Lipoprotein signal peptidase n=1 Tax=candidate division LCP-89 bacterium B3_LCP TaxID=2012998 RepID=A0A532UZU3_UNCL8|nr:MAG: signal peptidase II [candidate division LCP-89 bacterium B3_LCP]
MCGDAISVRLTNLIYLWPTLAVLIFDQLSKHFVRSSMNLGETINVIGEEFFKLTYVQNSGIAFGLKPGSPLSLIIFSSLASIVILYILLTSHKNHSLAKPKTVRISLALILGGAIGNLIDRIHSGRVTDFLDFDFPDFIMTRWPIFNIADSAVTVGVSIWCIYLLFTSGDKKEKLAESVKQNDTYTSEIDSPEI